MKYRMSRERMFLEITHIVARRSTCNRARVGAVLVQDNRIISIGYNGSAPGEPHCDEAGHLMEDGHCVRTIHAEMNCLAWAHPRAEAPLTMYVSHYPCGNCMVEMLKYNQKHPEHPVDLIIYDYDYRNTIGGAMYDPREDISTYLGGGISVRQLREM